MEEGEFSEARACLLAFVLGFPYFEALALCLSVLCRCGCAPALTVTPGLPGLVFPNYGPQNLPGQKNTYALCLSKAWLGHQPFRVRSFNVHISENSLKPKILHRRCVCREMVLVAKLARAGVELPHSTKVQQKYIVAASRQWSRVVQNWRPPAQLLMRPSLVEKSCFWPFTAWL